MPPDPPRSSCLWWSYSQLHRTRNLPFFHCQGVKSLLSNCLEEMQTPGSRGNIFLKILVDKVAQTEKTAFEGICASGTPNTGITTSPLSVKAVKAAISSLELDKLNEITNFSFLELATKNGTTQILQTSHQYL